MFSQTLLSGLFAACIINAATGNPLQKRQADGSTGGAKADDTHSPHPLPSYGPSACEPDATKVASMGYIMGMQSWFNLGENAEKQFCNDAPGQCTGQAEVTPFPNSGGKLWLCSDEGSDKSAGVTGRQIADAVAGLQAQCGPKYMFGGTQAVGNGGLYIYVDSATA